MGTLTGANSLAYSSSQSQETQIRVRLNRLFLGVFLLNKFSWPAIQLWPEACHTYLESYDTQLWFGLSGNHFSASYENTVQPHWTQDLTPRRNHFLVYEAILAWGQTSEQTTDQPSDPRVGLLLTSEKAVLCKNSQCVLSH